MRRIIPVFLLFCLPLLSQQEFELTLSTKGLNLIEIGIAQFSGDVTDRLADARSLLSRDLQLTGVFQVVPDKNMNLVAPPQIGHKIDCEKFLSVGAKILITADIHTEANGQILFSGVVTDAKTCKKIVSRKYRAK